MKSFIDSRTRVFIGRQEEVEHLLEFARSTESGYFMILGEVGSGKSALLANFCHRIKKENPRALLFPYFLGASRSNQDIIHLLDWLFEELRQHLQIDTFPSLHEISYRDYRKFLWDLLRDVSWDNQEVILVIDGIHQLRSFYHLQQYSWLPPILPGQVKVIFSATSKPEVESLASEYAMEILRLPSISSQDTLSFAQSYLREKGKILHQACGEKLLAQPGETNLLYLQLLLREACKEAGGDPIISQFATEKFGDLREFLFGVFQKLEDRFGLEPIRIFLTTLAVSRFGATKGELIDLLTPFYPTIKEEWPCLEKETAPYLFSEGGLINFIHPQIREIVEYRYFIKEEDFYSPHALLAKYFLNKGIYHPRSLSELAYHLLYGKLWKELIQLLTDISFLEKKCYAGLVDELLEDFNLVLTQEIGFADQFSLEIDGLCLNKKILQLIRKALLLDCAFIEQHPQELFQCLWNRCYWHDAPQTAHHYQSSFREKSQRAPWKQKGPKVYLLVEKWREQKEADPAFQWLKSHRPMLPPLEPALIWISSDHSEMVNAACFSPDGKQIASASDDRIIRLWDVDEAGLLGQFIGHKAFITSVAFSPSGDKLASASWDQTIRIWDVATQKKDKILLAHKSRIHQVVFSPQGSLLASAGEDGHIGIWDWADKKILRILKGHQDCVHGVAFSPDGGLIASASWDQTIRLWDGKTGKQLCVLRGHTDGVHSVVFSPDGKLLASCSDDCTVRIWDVEQRKIVQILRGHRDMVRSVAFHPRGKKVASGGGFFDRSIHIWSLERGEPLYTLESHTGSVKTISFSPDGNKIVSGAEDGTLRIWSTFGIEMAKYLIDHQDAVYGTSFSLQGNCFATASWDRTVKIWDREKGTLLCTLAHNAGVSALMFSPNGKVLATASWDRRIRVWNSSTGELLYTFKGGKKNIGKIFFNPQGTIMITYSKGDDSILSWDLKLGREVVLPRAQQMGMMEDFATNLSQRIEMEGTIKNYITPILSRKDKKPILSFSLPLEGFSSVDSFVGGGSSRGEVYLLELQNQSQKAIQK